MYGRRHWKPSKTQAREFAQTMDELREYCRENGIDHSASMDSYYFYLNGRHYRVSNHSIEASNAHAYDEFGRQVRSKYHNDERDEETVYIHASKTRIREIYENLKAGKKLDGHGNVIG